RRRRSVSATIFHNGSQTAVTKLRGIADRFADRRRRCEKQDLWSHTIDTVLRQRWPKALELPTEDIRQEVLLRVLNNDLAIPRRAPKTVPLERWLRSVIRRVESELIKRLNRKRLASMSGASTPSVAPSEDHDAEDHLRWSRRLISTIIPELPPPYAQIIALRALPGTTHAKVASYLKQWRGISADRALELEERSLEMARAVLRGLDIRRAWPRRSSPKNV
ncbi:MAG TPA: hypothetical protein PKA37_17010, partial [Planctomycetota bacterium]|nr:hypothetical protein [Planctomycetota bacterium]